MTVVLAAMCMLNVAAAGEVEIVAADFNHRGDNHWSVSVTLKHADSGWDHYADNWRIEDSEGNVLGDRILYHPHVDEQPFTRGLSDVVIPPQVETVYVMAHDRVHGWSAQRMQVDLAKFK
jgi:hypothetical protein